MINRQIPFIYLILCFIIAGCSSGGNMPTSVGTSSESITPISFESIPVGVNETDESGKPIAGSGTMGLFSVHIDPFNLTGGIISLRKSALEDVLETVDISNFLQLAPCHDCVKLESVAVNNDGHLVLAIGIKHPFEPGDPFMPITGRNRADLHVFNVEGIVISDNPVINYSGIGKSIANFQLLNADGYTGYLSAAISEIYPISASIHPYILHFDDYSSGNFSPVNPMGFQSVTVPPPSGNLVMPMGSDYDVKEYVFAFTDEMINFIFAVGCTYAVSSESKAERFSPEYRVPQHNKKAPSEVWVDVSGGALESGDSTSSTTAQIFVVDINHGISVGNNLDEMRANSSVASIQIDIPGITSTVIYLDPNPVSGSGHNPSDPLLFEVEIFNETAAEEGIYSGLVRIVDSYSQGLNESSLLSGMDGIKRVDPSLNPLQGIFEISTFETYQIFSVEVVETITSIYVKNTHPGPIYNGTRQNPFSSIQDGIDAAPDGWIVLVDDTDTPYIENVFMKDRSTVLSENWDPLDGSGRAVIDPPETENMGTINFINVSNATLSGFHIGYCGVQMPGYRMNMVVIDSGSNNIVRNCSFGGITDATRINCFKADNTTDLTVEYCTMENIDTVTQSLYMVSAISANNCPGLVYKNNRMTGWFETPSTNGIWTNFVDVKDSNDVIVSNNVISHMIPKSNGNNAQALYGFYLERCNDAIIINNTVDDLNVNDSLFIQQVFAYYFVDCTAMEFKNNIASRLHADFSFPPGLARGVQNMGSVLICDYTCIYDVYTPYFTNPPHGEAYPGIGAILLDPDYLDPDNNNYDLSATSPAQEGDPSFIDWDDDNSGGYQSRSRMGTHGGPDGEYVGIIS